MSPAVSAPFWLTVLLGTLIALTPLGTDTYLPALPRIAAELGASVSETQFTVTTFFLGLALGQLAWGPVSDRLGRRPVLLAGLALALAASLAGAAASSIGTLGWVRFAQGIGLSAGPVVARSVVRDLYSHEQAAQLLARMTIVFSVVPVGAPLLGALLLELGWRAIFWLLAAVSLGLAFAVARGLTETAPAERESIRPGRLVQRFAGILADRRFIAPFLTLLATFGGIFAWVSNSSFVLVQAFGVSPAAYALMFALVMSGQVVGAWGVSRLVVRVGIATMLRVGTRIACVAGAAMLALSLAGFAHWGAVVAPMMLYMFACSMIIPSATAAALSPFPRAAGAVSSLIGATQFALGAIVSALLGAAFDGTARPIALVVALGGAAALACERWAPRRARSGT